MNPALQAALLHLGMAVVVRRFGDDDLADKLEQQGDAYLKISKVIA